MRTATGVFLLILFAGNCGIAAYGQADAGALIAAVERKLPWLWSPAAEGLADIPYTYEQRITRRIWTRSGKEVAPAQGAGGLSGWRVLQFERIPLDWGSFMRCLSQDGVAPCSDEWVRELERQAKRREELTPDDRARIDVSREERRGRRRDFWDHFPEAFRFEPSGVNQLRFLPSPSYRPRKSGSMLTAVSGRLWFDPSTHEITHIEYDLIRDVDEPFLRLPKDSRFEIQLEKQADQHYLPSRLSVRRRRGKAGEVEERTNDFSNFRRFETESRLEFADPR